MAIDKAIDSAQLNTDLTSIADAIREKAGLTDSFVFPEGFVQAIAGIEAGGGKIANGSWTPTSNGETYTVTHNLGEIPNFVIYFKETTGVTNNSHLAGGWIDSMGFASGPSGSGISQYYSGTFDITASKGHGAYGATTSTVTLKTYAFFMSGVKYRWYVGVI